MSIRWIDAGHARKIRSQSIYHGLAHAQTTDTPDTVVTVRPEDPYICIGYFQDAARELDLDLCRALNLPVVRRETGGGTVLIDAGQVFVQWICQPGLLPQKVEHRFQLFNEPLVETMKFFGIAAYHYPVNDVHVAGRKIVGTGAGTIGQAEVITGNFIFDFNTETMSRILAVPHPAFRQLIQQSLEQGMTWINRESSHPPSIDAIMAVYRKQCEITLGRPMVPGSFTAAEADAIEFAETKLAAREWLDSVQLPEKKNRILKIHAGVWVGWVVYEKAERILHVLSRIRENTLEMIRFSFGTTPAPSWDIKGLEAALLSVQLIESEVRKRVTDFFTVHNVTEAWLSIDDWTKSIMEIITEVRKVSGYA